MSEKNKTLDLKLISSDNFEVMRRINCEIIGKVEMNLYKSKFGNFQITEFSDNEGNSKEYLEYFGGKYFLELNSDFAKKFYNETMLIPLQEPYTQEYYKKLLKLGKMSLEIRSNNGLLKKIKDLKEGEELMGSEGLVFFYGGFKDEKYHLIVPIFDCVLADNPSSLKVYKISELELDAKKSVIEDKVGFPNNYEKGTENYKKYIGIVGQ
jgi:hypothetical protein